ncbi:GNAT family N-acetyltransferase [Streptomyces coeruleorubidus]|uniref:GNAT family N-acetyltransferase n=1 Tax=Streptomyces coeruleorubidus TaxID=116188 RepID=UPI00381B8544
MERTVIRPFEPTDLPGAAAALTDVHATDGYPVEGVARPEEWLRSDDVLASWVAEAEGEIVGHVAVMRPNGEAAVSLWAEQSGADERHIGVLARLFVVRRARNQAVGERLVRTAMAYGLRHNRRLVLDVMVKDTAAIRLYDRLGWLRTGLAAHRYGAGQQIEAICYVAPGAHPAMPSATQ